ncbi:MAG: M48 family metallopeptidase, partial [Verrucomicrobiota bacterium]
EPWLEVEFHGKRLSNGSLFCWDFSMEVAASPQEFTFPKKPENVPKDLAKATARYRFHAWLAMGGLMIFGLVYVGLTAWFSWSAYRLLGSAIGGSYNPLADSLKGGGAAILAIFLIKGLFFRRTGSGSKDFQVTAETEPRLFEFLKQVASEAGAPRPHKVFLSPAVNACVFYDLSLLNFLFPTRKNLEIGLSLVNVLTISELKAVLAHEFGHFAQRSMAVGRWVYTAQQVATQLIYHRDFLDSFLGFISRIDLRVAWIGWLLQLIVWSIRSILDTMLSLVMLAERALSREMEFQADLVAVSTTGSDALIHGLYRLQAADQAWQEATSFLSEQLQKGHATEDVFSVQSRILEHQRKILNDDDFGRVPDLPEEGRDGHRIFTPELAQPPQMWSTHPQNHLREANAKKTYIWAELDSRSAWEIFEHPQKLRREMSEHLFKDLEQKPQSMEATLAALDDSYSKEFLNPDYRGAYLSRSIVDHTKNPEDLFDSSQPAMEEGLYPESLTDEIEKLRNLREEVALLKALRNRTYESPDGKIRFRGEIIRRGQLGDAIETVQKELDSANDHLRDHDRRCRCKHYELACGFSREWGDYLKKLVGLHHYADHGMRNLIDMNRKLENTIAVVTADGNVSGRELKRLLADATTLHLALKRVYGDRKTLKPDGQVLQRLDVEAWDKVLDEDYKLPSPSAENISDFLQHVDGWLHCAISSLSDLNNASLEQLLVIEALIAEHSKNETHPGPAPLPGVVPAAYDTLVCGDERELQTKLNLWDRFQTASGFFAGSARFLVSFGMLAGAIYITIPEVWIEWFQDGNWRNVGPALLEWFRAIDWSALLSNLKQRIG